MQSKTKMQKSKELFITYFVSMLFAFTGGGLTFPLIQEKLENKYNLMSREKSLEYFALGQSLPGVISLNACILVGRDVAGWPGAFAAAAGTILPAFLGMLLIALSYTFISKFQVIYRAIAGIRAASVGIIFVTAIETAGRAKTVVDWLLVAFALIFTLFFNWNILIVVLLCGCFGVLRLVRKQNTSAE